MFCVVIYLVPYRGRGLEFKVFGEKCRGAVEKGAKEHAPGRNITSYAHRNIEIS
jgi:hypothetical protein